MADQGSSRDQAASDPMLNEMMDPDDPSTIGARSETVGGSSGDGGGDRNGAVPLLGLEPTSVEKAGLNPAIDEDSNSTTRLAPLLGTSTSQVLEMSRGSFEKRSTENICYLKLLRESGLSSGEKARKTAPRAGRVCYGKLLSAPRRTR